MKVLAGVSGTRSACISALITIGFSPVPFRMRNRRTGIQKKSNNELFYIALVSIEQEEQMIVISIGRNYNDIRRCFCLDWIEVN